MSCDTLVSITDGMQPEYLPSAIWNGSPFAWIVSLPPGSKGAIGRDIISALMQSYGLTPGMNGFGLRVNGQDVIVKLAMLWDQGILKFPNFTDTQFDHVICLALLPNNAMGWIVPKAEIWVAGVIRTDRIGVTAQHEGADAWLSNADPSNVPTWLMPYGGTIDQLMQVAQTQL